MKHDFEQRKQNRIDHAQEQARKNNQKANSLQKSASKMANQIPFGQPILVGHHSEKADRNFRKKIGNTYNKASEAASKAGYFADKAKAILANKNIFSDDPDALEKIIERIAKLEKLQEFMKSANKCLKKGDKESFLKLDYGTEDLWEKLNIPDTFHNRGFASYKLINNNANIRRLKIRRDHLKKANKQHTEETIIKGVRMIKNLEANRIQLIFDGMPSEEVRRKLSKGYSFRWCRTENAWQRHLNNTGIFAAQQFLNQYVQPDTESNPED